MATHVTAATGLTEFVAFPIELVRSLSGQLTANGAAAVEKVLQLPKNAEVASYPVTVAAGRAEWTLAAEVGHLRQEHADADGQTRTTVVVDFGVLRTVAGVGVVNTSKFEVVQVRAWAGIAFAEPAVAAQATRYPGAALPFASQIRSERLEIQLSGRAAVSDEVLGQSLLVQLPDLPADFELRINGGAPVWTAPGIVAAGARGWLAPAAADPSGLISQTVDLAAAVNALLADPAAPIEPAFDLHIVLSARVPGALQLTLPEGSATGLRYLAQVTLAPGQEEIRVAEEGLLKVPLALPSWVGTVERLALTVTAKLPPERTLPPVGPDVLFEPAAGGALPLAEMVLDPERAAAVALPADGLGELLGVRLPLVAEAGGAEVRALLLEGAAADIGESGGPGPPVDGGASKPVEIAAAPSAPGSAEAPWSTFTFPRPVKLGDPPPYVAILVTRGRVRWALSGAEEAGAIRFGPPDGPWQPLPGLGGLSSLGGRVRMTGHAAPDHPLPPLQLTLAHPASTAAAVAGRVRSQAAQPQKTLVTPTPQGVRVEVVPFHGLAAGVPPPAELQVVSLVAGTITLKDLVVTATRISTN